MKQNNDQQPAPHCGSCAYMMDEDIGGRGWCAMQDMYTFVDCGDEACEYHVERTTPKNQSNETI
jgi:hypothetical protein